MKIGAERMACSLKIITKHLHIKHSSQTTKTTKTRHMPFKTNQNDCHFFGKNYDYHSKETNGEGGTHKQGRSLSSKKLSLLKKEVLRNFNIFKTRPMGAKGFDEKQKVINFCGVASHWVTEMAHLIWLRHILTVFLGWVGESKFGSFDVRVWKTEVLKVDENRFLSWKWRG